MPQELQERYAHFDQMTYIKNRRAYFEATVRLARPDAGRYCIAVIDVIGLREVNDQLGHAVGDEFAVICARDASEVEARLTELIYQGII